jgi:hypothetical protein
LDREVAKDSPNSAALQRKQHDANVWVGLELVQYGLSLRLRDFAIKANTLYTRLIETCLDDIESQSPS